ncbi:hypothetical protein ALP27_03973 [Pseudomonas savastanoi pv. glycinea]|nr:hypothetical protein ALP27_03973 [Pseudomonas savastanoi pv. glycinea]RMW32031.1 hypothetical protein ALO96_03482 [Pseudomonas savastanoi pv. glycinea]
MLVSSKKYRARATRLGRRGMNKAPVSAEQPATVSQHACVGKSWADRLLDLLKIGIGLANLIVGFLKH